MMKGLASEGVERRGRVPLMTEPSLVAFDRRQIPRLLQGLQGFAHKGPGQLEITVKIRRRYQGLRMTGHVKDRPDRIIGVAREKVHGGVMIPP